MRTAVILQPSYLPWIGYFDQILRSDYFIYFDDVLYTKNDWRNRNRIKTANGTLWLSVPVDIKNRITSNLLIKDAKIKDSGMLRSHLKTIELNYKKAEYFMDFFPQLEEFMQKDWTLLADFNISFADLVLHYLGIRDKKMFRSSNLPVKTAQDATERLIGICKYFNATNYLTGDAARSYLNEDCFRQNNISVSYQQYHHPVYPQLWGEFVPYLSIIDLLFNLGKKSAKVITNKKNV